MLLVSAVTTTVGWSVLNLLPILPLDGGQAVRELLPGDPAVRQRRAAVVSILVAAMLAVAALALLADPAFPVVLLAFLAVSNVLSLRSPSSAAAGPTPTQQVIRLLWEGDAEQARALLAAQPPGVVEDLAVHGAVLACTDQSEQGLALLHQELARRPQDADVAALVALTHVLRRDWAAFEAFVTGPSGATVPPVVVERALQAAAAEGRDDVVARLGRQAR
jgi:hypothetical protein